MSFSIKGSSIVLLGLLAGMAGCDQRSSDATLKRAPTQASLQWATLTQGFVDEYFRAEPFFAAQSGKHEFDGQLPDFSADGIKREIAFLHDARAQLSAADPAALQPRERFDRDYLLAVVDGNLFWLEKARYPFSNPYWYLYKLDPDMYLSRNYAPLEARMKAYIKYARAIPKMVTNIRENLQGPLPKTFVELGVAEFGGFAAFYKNEVAAVFASVNDADLQKQLADVNQQAAQAMSNLKDHMVSLRRASTGGARHLRSGVSDLHARKINDLEAARGLDRKGRCELRLSCGRPGVVARFSRQVPLLRRPADSAAAQGDAGRAGQPTVIIIGSVLAGSQNRRSS